MYDEETPENRANQQLNIYTKDKLIIMKAGEFEISKIPYSSFIVFPRRNHPNEMFPYDKAIVSNRVWRMEEQQTQEWFLIDQFNEARKVFSDRYHKAIEYSSWVDHDLVITKRKVEKLNKVKSSMTTLKTYIFSIMGNIEMRQVVDAKSKIKDLCHSCIREIEKYD